MWCDWGSYTSSVPVQCCIDRPSIFMPVAFLFFAFTHPNHISPSTAGLPSNKPFSKAIR